MHHNVDGLIKLRAAAHVLEQLHGLIHWISLIALNLRRLLLMALAHAAHRSAALLTRASLVAGISLLRLWLLLGFGLSPGIRRAFGSGIRRRGRSLCGGLIRRAGLVL